MIRPQTIKSFFEQLTKKQISTVMDSDSDYISCTIEGNIGACVVRPSEYTDTEQEDTESAGGFIADKDHFLYLFKECNAVNVHFDEYL